VRATSRPVSTSVIPPGILQSVTLTAGPEIEGLPR
jgi:hypothetical protein